MEFISYFQTVMELLWLITTKILSEGEKRAFIPLVITPFSVRKIFPAESIKYKISQSVAAISVLSLEISIEYKLETMGSKRID